MSLYWAKKWFLRGWATCTFNQCQVCVLLWSCRLFSYINVIKGTRSSKLSSQRTVIFHLLQTANSCTHQCSCLFMTWIVHSYSSHCLSFMKCWRPKSSLWSSITSWFWTVPEEPVIRYLFSLALSCKIYNVFVWCFFLVERARVCNFILLFIDYFFYSPIPCDAETISVGEFIISVISVLFPHNLWIKL